MNINILDISVAVYLNKTFSSFIDPEHVEKVLKSYGFEARERLSRISIHSYLPNGLPLDCTTVIALPSHKGEDWPLRLNEILRSVEVATGEKQIRILCKLLKEAGHNPVLE